MRNNFRVDRSVNAAIVPCGMNSILYSGNCWQAARNSFSKADIGKDSWGEENSLYGVILSVWDDQKSKYIVKANKGF